MAWKHSTHIWHLRREDKTSQETHCTHWIPVILMNWKIADKITPEVKLKCTSNNFRSVKNKKADIAAVIDEHKPDISLCNEFWLNPDIESKEIFPENYKILRRVNDLNGGGVFQAVRSDMVIIHLTDMDINCEIIWSQCDLSEKQSKHILLGSHYRPSSTRPESLEGFDASPSKLGDSLDRKNVIITAGHFNAPDTNWSEANYLVSAASERRLEIVHNHDLYQHVNEPTRKTETSNNILDLVFLNIVSVIRHV